MVKNFQLISYLKMIDKGFSLLCNFFNFLKDYHPLFVLFFYTPLRSLWMVVIEQHSFNLFLGARKCNM